MSDVRVPYLDDLRFQELVDEAKRYVPLRAPAWTDHNVSDPGITLIEACASRVDQLSYRTNQVPGAVRARLLRLAGVVPTPPASALAKLTFARIGRRVRSTITVPAGTVVSTTPAYPGPAISFRTTHELVIPTGTQSGVAEARNVATVSEVLGVSAGIPGQRFAPSGTPFLTSSEDGTQFAVLTITVVGPDDTEREWRQVATFADVDESEPCFLWDSVARQVVFGPRTPYLAGRRHHGAVPVRGATVRASYDTSQGSLGNIPAMTLVSWYRSKTIAVANLEATTGGADAESLPEAVVRTNAVLVPLDRAVTAGDYAQILTRRVPGIARVRTTAARADGPDGAEYLQVTAVPEPSGRPGAALPASDQRLSATVAAEAGQCVTSARLLCARVRIADPAWIPFKVAATVYSWASNASLAGQAGRDRARAALFRYFHPTLGGPEGTGWPFGRPVHVGDAYSVLAGLPETITVVDVAIANQAGISTSWIDVPPDGLPLLERAEVDFVASGTDEFERVPQGTWGLFTGTDGTGKLLSIFPGDAADLEGGVGASARSAANATSYTLEIFTVRATRAGRAPSLAEVRHVVYPGTIANLSGPVRSAIVHLRVPDGTFCLYEHPAQAGKQWIFWPAAGPIDLTLPGIGADLAVSSALNRTRRTLELRAEEDSGLAEQLIGPGEAADLTPALNDKARYATLLDGPGEGQYCLTATHDQISEQWVFSRSIRDLLAVIGPDRTVVEVANQTPYPVALYPQPNFMTGLAGLQSAAPRSTSEVLGPMAGSVASAEIRPLGSVIVWGEQGNALADVPSGLTDVFAAAAGPWHGLAVRSDGMVTAWGSDAYGQSSVPPGLTGVVAVAAGIWHSLALTADGQVAAWGDNKDRQTAVPPSLNDAVAIAAGGTHSMAVRADGTVVAWGYQTRQGQALHPPPGLTDVVAIATSIGHALAVKADGTVTAWGDNSYGATAVPDGLSGVIAVAAGIMYSLALLADGTVTAWGYQTGPGGINQVPDDLSDVVAITASSALIVVGPTADQASSGTPAGSASAPDVAETAAGAMRSLALRADGSIVTWGAGSGSGEAFASPAITASRSVVIAAGEEYSLAVYVTK